VGASCRAESKLITQLSGHTDALYDTVETLSNAMAGVPKDAEAASKYYRGTVIPVMEQMRRHADVLETLTDKNYWPYPTYSDLLFY
jgi:glutamine synthetase